MRNTCLCIPHGLFLSADLIRNGRIPAHSHGNLKFITATVERGRD